MKDSITFQEALDILGIRKYEERIWNSSSTGELFFIADYVALAEIGADWVWFPEFFEGMVAYAEENWERPESVFQHVLSFLKDTYNENL